jgi:hypothetical protein
MSEAEPPSDEPAAGTPGETPDSGDASSGKLPTEAKPQSGIQKPPVYVTDMREADTPDVKQSRS